MEIKKISEELERIVESKRIPNALIFETDGLNSESVSYTHLTLPTIE